MLSEGFAIQGPGAQLAEFDADSVWLEFPFDEIVITRQDYPAAAPSQDRVLKPCCRASAVEQSRRKP